MQTVSLKAFSNDAERILSRVHSKKSSVLVTKDDSPAVIIQNFEEYNKLKDALLLMKLMLHSEAEIKKGRLKKQEDVFREIEEKLLK